MITPEPNPYEVSPFTDPAATPGQRSKPGPVAVVFSVILGLVVAVVMFCVTFFFTCLGMMSVQKPDINAAGEVIVFAVAGVTAIASFIFTYWGMLKLVRMFKSQ